MIRVLGTVFAALMGLAFGSFLNVCLTRWPAGESIVKPRSHCRNCGRTLAWWENVPLVSWIALRGRCRSCGTWIGWRYVIVEATLGACCAIAAWQKLGLALTRLAGGATLLPSTVFADFEVVIGTGVFCFLLLGLAALDAQHMWLPDAVTLPGIALGIAFSVSLILESIQYFTVQPPIWQTVTEYLLGILAAAALILLIRWIYKLIRHREGLGLGDAKLMAMLAAWLGFPGALLSFAIGVILGSLAAIILLARGAKSTTQETWATTKLPLGTFLCIGGIVSSLWGQPIIAAYLRWAGF